jgi:hypothetical protein
VSLSKIVMVLLVGLLCGLYNPHQLAQELGCAPGAFYGALHSLSATQWRQLLERIMRARALERLQHYQQRSEATRSRLQATLAIDDSVVKRLGRVLSYIWSWYSGQFKQVVRGQDLVGLVLHINGETIPLALIWVSKQGSGPTSKPEVLLQEMNRLKEHFATHGIALTQVGLSLDSWWISQPLIEGLIELGFDQQVLAAKASVQLRDATGTANLGERYTRATLKAGWGHARPAERLRGENSTLGQIVVVLFTYPQWDVSFVCLPSR